MTKIAYSLVIATLAMWVLFLVAPAKAQTTEWRYERHYHGETFGNPHGYHVRRYGYPLALPRNSGYGQYQRYPTHPSFRPPAEAWRSVPRSHQPRPHWYDQGRPCWRTSKYNSWCQ
ncbi:MAG: hypothetical protein AAB421_00215 [Patescibacteria group bacterium]